jgi:glycolate oxidase FAD binding subunit
MRTAQARTVEDVQECVRAHGDEGHSVPLRPVAGRSKSALSSEQPACVSLDVSAIAGVIDYQPDECTFSARAATRVADVEAMLAERGQYLPFEPPFVDRGATLGGTVAAALSGPGRLRYGGVRDFLLGVRFVDGEGRIIRGGGRVVKNAAGFYLQHLLLGSLGTLGVLTEITCKVFPRPQARTTLVSDHGTLTAALDALARLRRSPFELESAELIPPARLLLRLGGSRGALAARAANLSAWLRGSGSAASGGVPSGAAGAQVGAAPAAVTVRQIVDEEEERQCWHEARELTWAPAGVPLVKVATTLGRLDRLDQRLAADNPARRYGAGGDIAWIAWPHALSTLDTLLTDLALPGLVVIGDAPEPDAFLGQRPDPAFLARVRRTLDPRRVFSV